MFSRPLPSSSLSLSLSLFRRSFGSSFSPSNFITEGTFPSIPSLNLQNKLFINNEFISSSTSFAVKCPSTGTPITDVYSASSKEVDMAVESATKAFHPSSLWRTMHPRQRGNLLFRLADLIDANRQNLASIEAINNGKTFQQAMNQDLPATSSMFRYWAGWADKITGRVIPTNPSYLTHTHHEPVGICGLIIPWNLPLIAAAAKMGPALTAGNVIILKSAEQTPLTALKLAELVKEAGFPPGVVNILSGEGKTTGSALVKHKGIQKISFTGSVDVGKLIQSQCASTLKRTTMELGGKNPVIVHYDADLSIAVPSVFNGLFWNKGEACASGSRIYVHEKILNQFTILMKEHIAKRTVGHPFHGGDRVVDQGAQVSEEQMTKVMKFIEIGKREGATLAFGGEALSHPKLKGNFIQPTLFTNVTDEMTLFKHEIFGPVMCLSSYSDLDDVERRANHTEFGLAAGIFSTNSAVINRLSKNIQAGLMFVNCYHVVDVSAPFGGFKSSGIGREGGEYGLLPYVEVKNIVERRE